MQLEGIFYFSLICENWMPVEEEITAPKPSQKCYKIDNLKLILEDVWMTNREEWCEVSLNSSSIKNLKISVISFSS